MKKINKGQFRFILFLSLFLTLSFSCQRVMDDGEEDDGHHDELDEVQEDGAEGLDIGLGEVHAAGDGHQGQTGHDADDQAHEDPKCKGQFLCVHFLSS